MCVAENNTIVLFLWDDYVWNLYGFSVHCASIGVFNLATPLEVTVFLQCHDDYVSREDDSI